METKFEINGKKFSLSKINALKQFHIARRVGPTLADLLPGMKDAGDLKKIEKFTQAEQLEFVAKFAGPVMEGLAKLSDADAEFVLYGLLSAVEMQQVTGNWAKVAVDSMLMIQDLELPILLQLAGRAFMFNMTGFFSGLPQ